MILGNGHKITALSVSGNFLYHFCSWTGVSSELLNLSTCRYFPCLVLNYCTQLQSIASCQYVAKDGGTIGDAALIVIELGGVKNVSKKEVWHHDYA
jgi:hypothetical protein